MRADFSFIHLVTVTVEMALGASVKPFTKTTARVRIIEVKVKGENCKTITTLKLDYLYSLFTAFPFNIYENIKYEKNIKNIQKTLAKPEKM